jgi:hypothetical protein
MMWNKYRIYQHLMLNNLNLRKRKFPNLRKMFLFCCYSGDSSSAVKFYEQGITRKEKDLQHDQKCLIGLARCYIKVGELKK